MADLTTIEKVRRYLFGNDTTFDADEILADLITSSSAWVERQIGRTFGSGTVTETKNGDGTSRMLLEQNPATAVTSVTVDGVAVPARTVVSGTGWVLSDDGIDLVGYSFTAGIQNVVIVYTAGEAVPADLEQAVIEHVALKYRDRSHIGLDLKSGGGEYANFSNAGALAFINDVLDRYRDLVVA